jgi:hypothetical protein
MQRGRNNDRVSRAELVAGFADLTMQRREEVERLTNFLDVRPATDPESRGYAHHTGEHPAIKAHVADWGVRLGWFADTRRVLREVRSREASGDLQLVLYCRSGKHRSVAMAMLLYETLRRTQQYIPSAPIAFIHWSNLARCGGAPRCAACSEKNHTLEQTALAAAFHQWGFQEVGHGRE